MRNRKDYIILALKGCAMGMADVVPGVSGGTIAFISGIYEELLDSIRSINGQALRLLFGGRFGALWRQVNGNFLTAVFVGIGVAFLSLARVMTWLLENEPVAIWSFFFGLIIASAILVGREVRRWSVVNAAALLTGGALAWWITVATPAQTPTEGWFVFLTGAVAICAMILPGISGSFILLLLGKYAFMMEAIGNLRIKTIALFGAGAVVGIVSFSHLLSWLLKRWHDVTVALLMGFMLGSLNKVWPWKEAVGETVERNVTPGHFAGDPEAGLAVVLCAAGFLLIWGIEWIGKRINRA